MSTRITLAANAVDSKEVHLIVSDEWLLPTLEALASLSEQRLARGSTPLNVANVAEVD